MTKFLRYLIKISIFVFFMLPVLAESPQILKEKKEVITKAFQKIFGTTSLPHLHRLLGGYSSPGIYTFIVNGKKFVLRLSHPNRTLKDEERSVYCMKTSANRGISPKVYYADPNEGIAIMEYIDTKKFSLQEMTQPKNIQKLAVLLRNIHNGPEFPDFLTIFEVRKMFERSLGENKPQILKETSTLLNEVEGKIDKKIAQKSCHNDLKPENVLFDGKRFWIIDWEAASKGNPFFDIATVILFFALTPSQEESFLDAYFERKPNHFERAQLNLMKPAVLGYYGTAYLMVARYKSKQSSSSNFHSLNSPDTTIKNSLEKEVSDRLWKLGLILLEKSIDNEQ